MWKTAEEFLNGLSTKQREDFKETFILSLGPELSKKYSVKVYLMDFSNDESIKQRLERNDDGDVVIKLK